MTNVTIVGAGQAGAQVARMLREREFDGEIRLIGDEPHLPYERPPLSKSFLKLGPDLKNAVMFDECWIRDNHVDLLTNNYVANIDLHSNRLDLQTGEKVRFDVLVLTTGSSPRRLKIEQEAETEIYSLRTFEDSSALYSALSAHPCCCIVGGGLIGLEVAASARQLGCEVHVIESTDRLLPRVCPPAVSMYMGAMHRNNGVNLHLNTTIDRIKSAGRTKEILLTNGERIYADVIILGIGVEPNVALAHSAGIACRDGIVVDEYGRTNARNVFAAGDVARFWNPRYSEYQRAETWDNAQRQPEVVANWITGTALPYRPIPFGWTDQFDETLQMIGVLRANARFIQRGAASGQGSFACFAVDNQRVTAGWLINCPRDRRPLIKLIDSAQRVDCKKLSDNDMLLQDALDG